MKKSKRVRLTANDTTRNANEISKPATSRRIGAGDEMQDMELALASGGTSNGGVTHEDS
jgi:hypothetical protein